jgi:hypothetical protein
VDFGKTLSEKLDKTFKPVCSKHRDELPKVARAHFLPGRPGIVEA